MINSRAGCFLETEKEGAPNLQATLARGNASDVLVSERKLYWEVEAGRLVHGKGVSQGTRMDEKLIRMRRIERAA